MELIFNIADLSNAANWLLENIKTQKCVAFHGEMGAGKTTFITAICRHLGAGGDINSPTFSIINEYKMPTSIIYHIDLYRLKNEQEAILAGVEDCLTSGNYCFVEWPERAQGLFPEGTAQCYLTLINMDTRKLVLNL